MKLQFKNMHKLNRIIPNVVLTILLAIAAVACLLFYFGGDVDPTAEISEPVYTDFLLDYMYILLILAIVVAIVAAAAIFITKHSATPKSAVTAFMGIGFLALLMILTYVLGDATPLNILGFEGRQTEFDLRLTDMCLYSSYILLGIAVIVSGLSFLSKTNFFNK